MFKTKYALRNADPNQPGAGAVPQNNPASTTPPAAGAPAAVDVQAQVNQALQSQQAEFAKQLKEATGHSDLKSLTEANLLAQGKLQELADTHKAGEQKYKGLYEQTAISNALLAASTQALDPVTVKELLAGRGQVDGNGNVTIDGKPVAEAVKQLLADRPFLAKPEGGTGSGAPQNAGGGKQLARAEFEKLDAAARDKFIKDGGSVV